MAKSKMTSGMTCGGSFAFWILLGATVAGILLLAMVIYRMSQPPSFALAEKYADNNQARLIYFHMKGCPHCESFNPVWDAFVKELASFATSKDIALVKLDSYAPENEKFGIAGYPTVVFERGGSVVAKFEDERTLEKLKEFLEKHAA